MSRLFVALLKILWGLLVILTPILGAWTASSLAAYRNGPIWLAASIGLLLFPILPVLWDVRARRKRRRKLAAKGKDPGVQYLTWYDRIILRTLAINLLFLGVLLGWYPQAGFEALSTRGDWMLEGREGPRVETARDVLFTAATGLEWLYEWTSDNPYEQEDVDSADKFKPKPNERGAGGRLDSAEGRSGEGGSASGQGRDDNGRGGRDNGLPRPLPAETPQPGKLPLPLPLPDESPQPGKQPLPLPLPDETQPPSKQAAGKGKGEPGRQATQQSRDLWPLRATVHPAVTNMPTSAETSIASVARYLGSKESDPFRLVKALHDYVATRVVYDVVVLTSDIYPPQDAETVFRKRLGVCAGYANLMKALGKELNIEVTYVVGKSRDMNGEVGGVGHAWNAVRIEKDWYLMDVTWDAGSIDRGNFVAGYRTAYLFTPPKIFGLDHFPDDDGWQLREDPISRGEFMRQPLLRPDFFAQRLELIAPRRSQVAATGDLSMVVGNPARRYLMGVMVPLEASGVDGKRCNVHNGRRVQLECRLPREGVYRVMLFSAEQEYNVKYGYVGQIQVTNRL